MGEWSGHLVLEYRFCVIQSQGFATMPCLQLLILLVFFT